MEPKILFAVATSVAHIAVVAPVTPLINKFLPGFPRSFILKTGFLKANLRGVLITDFRRTGKPVS